VIGAELPAELEALQALAREQRLDLAAAAHAVRRLGFQREAARALRLPELRAFAAYDMDGSELALDSELDSTTVGLALRLPLSLRTAADIHQAEAEERRARAELAELAQAAAQEVGDALERWGAARTTEELATSSVGAAEEAYRILAAAQDAGAATVTDVLEAQDERNRARVGLVVARAGVALARARLVAATGGVR
jgi:outer membrane protein TolC